MNDTKNVLISRLLFLLCFINGRYMFHDFYIIYSILSMLDIRLTKDKAMQSKRVIALSPHSCILFIISESFKSFLPLLRIAFRKQGFTL